MSSSQCTSSSALPALLDPSTLRLPCAHPYFLIVLFRLPACRAVRTGAEGIPPVLLQRAQDLFHEFDTDENGSVDAAELMAVMRCESHSTRPVSRE